MSKNNNVRAIDETTPLLLLAGPIFGELFLNILVNNIDTMMLSRYSQTAAGAVGNANQIMMLMIIMFNIIATATSVVVSQYLGAKKYDMMNKIYALAFLFNLFMGILLSGALVLFRYPIMNLLNVRESMTADASLYIIIVGGGLFLQACYNVMLQILRCNGYSKVGMYISVVINLINIVGNFTFLYGPLSYLNLGVAGVAISTVTARVVALMIAVIYFYTKKIGSISPKYIRPFPFALLGSMVKVGLPSAGENLAYNLYQLFLMSLINNMGDDAVLANVSCKAMISFAMVFSNSCAMATQIITGHLVGAGKEDAAYKRVFQTLKISLPITIGLATANWLLSPLSLRLFTDNPNVIHLGFYIMLVDILIEIGRCLNMTFVNSLKAAGDYIYPLIVGLISMWGIGAVVGYSFGVFLSFGVAGVFFGTAMDEFLRGLVVMRHWAQKKWYGKSLVKK